MHAFSSPVLLTLALALGVGPTAPAQGRDVPPSTPADLAATAYSGTAGAIRWARSSDDGIVVGYAVTRDGVALGTVDALSRVDDDLAPGRAYRYTVTAVDDAGQRSATAAVTLRTPGMTSTSGEGPTAPDGLRSRAYSPTAGELFWTRPATSGLRYEVRRIGESGEVVASTDGTSYHDDTLLPGRDYRFEVVAIDRDGRRSEAATVTLTTGGSALPSRPGGLAATRYSASAGEIFWARQTGLSRRYEVSRDNEVLGTTDGTSFYDDALEAGRSYRYEVVAIDPFGRRSQGSTVVLDNGGVLAIVDIERLSEQLFDVINGTRYRTAASRLHQRPERLFVDALAPLAGGEPIRASCPGGGTASAVDVAGPAAQTTTRYTMDGCNFFVSGTTAYDGELTYTSGTFDGFEPVIPRVPGTSRLRLSEARGPLTVRRSIDTLTWQGDSRLRLLSSPTDRGVAFDLDFDSLTVGTLTLRDVDTAIICTREIPLRIDSRLAFSSSLTGGQTFEVRVPETLRVFDRDDGRLGMSGHVVATAEDGRRLEFDWRGGDGSTFRASVENGALGGERTLSTIPLLEKIYQDLGTLSCPARGRL